MSRESIQFYMCSMTFSSRTHFYGTSGTACENMFTIVVNDVRSRIVTDFIDSYDKCEPGFKECVP